MLVVNIDALAGTISLPGGMPLIAAHGRHLHTVLLAVTECRSTLRPGA